MAASAIVSLIAAYSCSGGFAAKTNAFAESIGTLVSCFSSAVVDETGNVLSTTITASNNSEKEIAIEETIAPTNLSTWNATFDEDSISSNSSVNGTWDGTIITDDVLTDVKNNGSSTLAFQLIIGYDNTETTGNSGIVSVYDPVTKTDQIITVTGEAGEAISGADVETDESGKTFVVLPERQGGKGAVVKIQDSSENPVIGQKVEASDTDETSRGEAETNDQGEVKYTQLDFDNVTIDDATYDGTQKKPTITIPGFVEGVDFQVTAWGENINAGTNAGSVTIKGIGTCKGEATLTFDIAKAKLTVSGIKGVTRDYDGSTNIDLDYSAVQFAGLASGETLTTGDLVVTANGVLRDKKAGDNKPIKISGLSLSGTKTNNYELAASGQQTEGYVKINKVEVEVDGLTVDNKVYDGTTDATLKTDAATFAGKVSADVLGVEGKATFAVDANAGDGKTVTISELKLTGDDAVNYTLSSSSQSATTANITKRKVTVTGITADGKTYDGNAAATVKFASATVANKAKETDDVTVSAASGTFADSAEGAADGKDVGTNKTVTISGITLTGASVGNYELDAVNS